MGSKAPWMPFYGFDFFADRHVRTMTLEQKGAYVQLLWAAWTEGGIPADLADMAVMLGIPTAAMKRIWEKVGRCWHVHQDDPGLLIQERMEIERDRKAAVIEAKRAAGKKGGRPKKEEADG